MPDCVFELDAVTVRLGRRAFFHRLAWRPAVGETWAVLGPNGAGKTLLAAMLAGEVHPDAGVLRFGWGEPAEDRSAVARVSTEDQRALLDTRDGYYQSRYESLGDTLNRTTREFLSRQSVEGLNPFEVLPARPRRRKFPMSRAEVIRRLALQPLLHRRLHQLSNGEQRRALIAHALLQRPRLLLLDDPCSGLDAATRQHLQRILSQLIRAGVAMVLFAQRPEDLPRGVTHTLQLDRGRPVSAGPCQVAADHTGKEHARILAEARPASRQPPRPTSPRATGISRAPQWPPHLLPRPARPPALQLRHATVQYGRTTILRDVSWTIAPGEHWAVLGPNGSGKSTLLSLIMGDHPQAYAVDLQLFGRRPGAGLSRWEWMAALGFVSPELHLHQPASEPTIDIVCSGYTDTVGLHETVSRARQTRARQLLHLCGVTRDGNAKFGELSAGEQRLALLARALVKRPALLILDEPCQGLDAAHRRAVVAQLDTLGRHGHAQLVVVTHHPDEIPGCVQHILQLSRGRARVDSAD